MCGTLDYLAPEIVKEDCYTKEIDIWCSGVLMFEMLTTSVPFHNASEEGTMSLIKQAQFSIPAYVSAAAQDLIRNVSIAPRTDWPLTALCPPPPPQILRAVPNERYSLAQIQAHEYIKQFSENTTGECKAALQMWNVPSMKAPLAAAAGHQIASTGAD